MLSLSLSFFLHNGRSSASFFVLLLLFQIVSEPRSLSGNRLLIRQLPHWLPMPKNRFVEPKLVRFVVVVDPFSFRLIRLAVDGFRLHRRPKRHTETHTSRFLLASVKKKRRRRKRRLAVVCCIRIRWPCRRMERPFTSFRSLIRGVGRGRVASPTNFGSGDEFTTGNRRSLLETKPNDGGLRSVASGSAS